MQVSVLPKEGDEDTPLLLTPSPWQPFCANTAFSSGLFLMSEAFLYNQSAMLTMGEVPLYDCNKRGTVQVLPSEEGTT